MQLARIINKISSIPNRRIVVFAFIIFLGSTLSGCNFLNKPFSLFDSQEKQDSVALKKEADPRESKESRGEFGSSQLVAELSLRNSKVLFDNDIQPKQVWPVIGSVNSEVAKIAKLLLADGLGRLYFLDSQDVLRLIDQPKRAKFAISDDFNLLAVCDGPKVDLYNLAELLTSTLKNSQIEPQYQLNRLVVEVLTPKFDADSSNLFFSGSDGRVYRWRFKFEKEISESAIFERGKSLEIYIGPTTIVSAVETHPSKRVVAAADWGGKINFWLLYDQDRFFGKFDPSVFGPNFFADDTARRQVSSVQPFRINNMIFSPDGLSLVSTSDIGLIELFQIRGLNPLANFAAHKGVIRALAANKDFSRFATCGRDGWLRIWKIENSLKQVGTKEFQLVEEKSIPQCYALNYLPDGNLLLGQSGELEILDVN